MSRPLLLLNLAHAYDHFFLLIFPTAVLALAPAWGLSYGEALTYGTAAFVTFGLGTLPAGWLGDRWHRGRLMTVFFLGIGGASVATGLAQGPITLTLGLAAIGLFAAIYHPVGTALVVQSAGRTGRALGINGVFGNLGVAAAGLVTGVTVDHLGWRAAFILPGLVAIATGLYFARHIQPQLGPGAAQSPKRPVGDQAPDAQIRVFIVVGISALLGGIVFHGTTVALPKIFEERLTDLGGDLSAIGILVAVVFALAALAQVLVGHLLDRQGARLLLPLITGLQAVCFLLVVHLFGWGMLALAAPMMLLVFGQIPINAWLIGHYAAPAWHSRIYGLQFTLSLGVSAAVVPLVAFLHQWSGGFAALFWTMAAAAAVVAAAALLLPGRPAQPSAASLAQEPVASTAMKLS